VSRSGKQFTNFVEFRNYKLVYKRYASLYFSFCVDTNDNELLYLETIHLFVELLDKYFESVCELDLVFNFNKVRLRPTHKMRIPEHHSALSDVRNGAVSSGRFCPDPESPSHTRLYSAPRLDPTHSHSLPHFTHIHLYARSRSTPSSTRCSSVERFLKQANVSFSSE